MDCEDDCVRQGLATVYALLTWHAFEVPLSDGLVERLVSDSPSLSHAVHAFHELHDPVFFARHFETSGLLHVGRFIFGEYTMEKGRFYVELLYIPV